MMFLLLSIFLFFFFYSSSCVSSCIKFDVSRLDKVFAPITGCIGQLNQIAGCGDFVGIVGSSTAAGIGAGIKVYAQQ